MNTPVLETDRLIIKSLNILDAKTMFQYRSDPHVTRFQSWHPVNEIEVSRFIQKYSCREFTPHNSWYQLGVYLKQSKELIGDIGIHFFNEGDQYVEIGYTISPVHQRKGYASEAVKKLISYLFTYLSLISVIAVIDSNNIASIALVSKLGFIKDPPNKIGLRIEKQSDDNLYFLDKTVWDCADDIK